MKMRWYQQRTHGVCRMISPTNSAPKVAASATIHAMNNDAQAASSILASFTPTTIKMSPVATTGSRGDGMRDDRSFCLSL
jgi:hypothetical protein